MAGFSMRIGILAISSMLVAGPVLAMGASDDTAIGGPWADERVSKARMWIRDDNTTQAILVLQEVVDKQPGNADAINYLAYAYRKSGDLDRAEAFYLQALNANPEHRGAREYLGELYLTRGDLPRAEAQLAALDELCFFGCIEYDELKQRIADYNNGTFTAGKRPRE